MSKIALLHLSDIHIKAPASKNPILKRAKAIANAVNSTPESLSSLLIVMSGDTAFSGRKSEYDLAASFYSDLCEQVMAGPFGLPSAFVCVPGNHDCNFEKSDSTRQLILNSRNTHFSDQSPLIHCLTVQEEFRDFTSELADRLGTQVLSLDSCHLSSCVSVGARKIGFQLLNTAWCSEIREQQGTLLFPKSLFEHAANSDQDLVVTVMHHPYNWFEADNGRSIRQHIEQSSDVILSGHEHEVGFYSKYSWSGERNEYIEGAVLQDSDDDANSGFNLIIIDIDAGEQVSRTYGWDSRSKRYLADDSDIVRPFQRNKGRLQVAFPFSSGFEQWVDDPGATFQHPHKQKLQLRDVFVYPDLRDVSQSESRDQDVYVRGNDLVNQAQRHKQILVVGPDTCGKTSIAKCLARDIKSSGLTPLYLEGCHFGSTDDRKIHKVLTKAVEKVYGKRNSEAYWQLEAEQRAVIVDDFHRIPLNSAGKSEVLTYLASRFSTLIVFAGDEIRFDELRQDELQPRERELVSLWDLKHYEIMELGFALRSQLIRKWRALGCDHSQAQGTLQRKLAETESQVNSFLGEQLMPAHPLFILIVLQQSEVQESIAAPTGSVGYLYEELILRCLANSVTPETDIDTNKNYLAELAHHLLQERATRLSRNALKEWHAGYCRLYKLSFDADRHIDSMTRAGLLEDQAGQFSFKYPYLYYYFVATYLTRHIHDEQSRQTIENLCTYLHQADAANIVLFLCHLSRDQLIFDAVMQTADGLFKGYDECDLDADVKFLNSLVEDTEPPQLSDGDPERRRQELLMDTDEKLRSTSTDNRCFELSVVEYEERCDIAALNDSLQLNSALKTIQIIGQILRNHVGSIRGDLKKDLVRKCYSLGLRATKCLFGLAEDNIESLVGALVDALERKQGGIPRHKLVQSVNKSVWGTIKLGTYSLIKYISDSVGTERLSQAFTEVLAENQKTPLRIIDLSIKLDHYRVFPETEAIKLGGELRNNPFAFSILRDLIFMRFYLYEVDYRVRQRICEKVLIPTSSQKRIIHQKGTRQRGKAPGLRERGQ